MTALAEKYQISRSFLYQLLIQLNILILLSFSLKEQEKQISKKEIVSKILLLRMVGGSSLSGISQIMKYDGLKYSGVGSISQILSSIGSLLPKVQDIVLDEKREIGKMVTDEGTGLCSAIRENNISWQSDTYHSIAHRLGKWISILERRAYKRINLEYERQRVIASAKNQKVINKRRYEYSKAKNKTLEAIEVYEDFSYLYQYIISQMQLFQTNGKIRNKQNSEENIMIALELLKTVRN